MVRPRHRRLRLYAELRSAHLERARALVPATILYRERNYDFDPALLEGMDVHQVSGRALVTTLLRAPIDALEINEPLMLGAVRRSAVAVGLLTLRGLVSRRPVVVTYAIENRPPFEGRPHGWKAMLRRVHDRVLAEAVWQGVDRVVFGTHAAQQVYRRSLRAPGRGRSECVIEALPEPLPGAGRERDPRAVVFLGELGARKGFDLVADAWPHVSDARLTVLGKGPLSSVARRLAEDPTVTFVEDPSREVIRTTLSQATVLVLPSRATATWREQVGLPIVEALAAGCRIVTTEGTGLAPWLTDHGHRVLRDSPSPRELAEALEAALEHGPSPAEVLASLPRRDGRLAADDWLFAGTSDSAAGRAP